MLGTDAVRVTRLFPKTAVRKAMPSVSPAPEGLPRGGAGRAGTFAVLGFCLSLLFVVGALARQPETSPIRESKNPAITPFDVPGAGNAAGQGTFGRAINSKGVVAGYYRDSGNVAHGFVRAADGTLITFDVPGAGTGSHQGTSAEGINSKGVTTGAYVDAGNVYHGFVRSK